MGENECETRWTLTKITIIFTVILNMFNAYYKIGTQTKSTNGRCLLMHDRITSSVLFRLDQETAPWIFQQLLLPILTSLSHTKCWFFFIDLNVWIHSFCITEKEPQYQCAHKQKHSVPTSRKPPVWRLTARNPLAHRDKLPHSKTPAYLLFNMIFWTPCVMCGFFWLSD